MSGIKTYKKKIAKYIADQEEAAKSPSKASVASKGFLAPKDTKKTDLQKQKTSVDYVSEYVYALRKQRNEIKAQRSKK